MIFGLAEAINNLSSPDLFDLSQQTSGQRPPLSVYMYAVTKVLCQPCVRPLLLQAYKTTDENLALQRKLSPDVFFAEALNNYLTFNHNVGRSGLGSGPLSLTRCMYFCSSPGKCSGALSLLWCDTAQLLT